MPDKDKLKDYVNHGKLLGDYGVQWDGVYFSHIYDNFCFKFNLVRFIIVVRGWSTMLLIKILIDTR